MNVKDSWNDSDHNISYLPQVLTFQHHILCFQITELNVQSRIQCWGNSAGASNFLGSGADVAAPMCSQSNAKPKFLVL
jgi:hypothetical protein